MGLNMGICLGATTVSVAERTEEGLRFYRLDHDGRVATTLKGILQQRSPSRLGITGRKFRHLVSLPTVAEPEAVEWAYGHLRDRYPDIQGIVSAGGESFLLYLLDDRGRIRAVNSGNKCAAGTGEFFLQQIRRMELGIQQALSLALAGHAEPYPVAGRCSVFCKSDCTHALNQGIEKSRITSGLCQMLTGRILALLQQTRIDRLLMVGGVSQNQVVVQQLRSIFPKLEIPPHASCFEALGALLWAEHKDTVIQKRSVLAAAKPSFESLPALETMLSRVSFRQLQRAVCDGGELVLGLDVGSTTTKAVLLRRADKALIASCYLRTHGDPVAASRRCYEQLLQQLPPDVPAHIVGLGVTGSGRRIAGLHALTPAVINEIVAHATAAVHFDPQVDTIFEIGGQDAKYTLLNNRVACDYAMNEACSAGTGSFLEEACRESLGIATEDIADLAMTAGMPPDFSDQCAAFISSDIKTAVQEGVSRADIAAGLVYAICQNYLVRVKGNRSVGGKIFMQGGVCYNRAVPVAMAALCQRDIVVPPEPGLMGAFGVALDLLEKIEQGVLSARNFDLQELAERTVSYVEPFICRGGSGDGCDRRCSISRIVVNGRTYPFGGACSRFEDVLQDQQDRDRGNNLVRKREKLVFAASTLVENPGRSPVVGILSSLLTHSLFPFYARFFDALGVRVKCSRNPDWQGRERMGAAFCYPVEQSHGLLQGLLAETFDFVFLPQVVRLPVYTSTEVHCICPLAQGEPYYLQAAFKEELEGRVLSPVLDFADSRDLQNNLITVARRLGRSRSMALAALDAAHDALLETRRQQADMGRRFLAELQPEEIGVVVFGRSYNAFSELGNLGIPHKFASRGFKVLAHDCLPLADLGAVTEASMYWASGQTILQAARIVAGHPKLFAVYISNFSCGPDSFLIGNFRDIMVSKPSLLLELDAHTADTGINTRIEAFIDVVNGYRALAGDREAPSSFAALRVTSGRDGLRIVDERGVSRRLTDPDVRLLLPSMGEHGTDCLAAAMRYYGIDAVAAPPPGREEMLRGRAVATCKECLPLHLTTGTLLKYLEEHAEDDQLLVFFMPRAQGPCRFGQYSVFLEHLVRKQRLPQVAILALSDKDGYAGMPQSFILRSWLAINISDGLEDVEAAILALARDREQALQVFSDARRRILQALEGDSQDRVLAILEEEMERLADCPRSMSLEQAPKVALNGEIYVRRDNFSRRHLVRRLAGQGIVVQTAPVAEWLYYVNYCIGRNLTYRSNFLQRLLAGPKSLIMRRTEKAVKKSLRRSGFFCGNELDINFLMKKGASLVHPRLMGEAILTVSSTLAELGDETHGVLSIGPFGCMPNRLAESILTYSLPAEKANFSRHHRNFWQIHQEHLALPFLAIETDGTPFSQIVEARLETFVLAVRRFKADLDRLNGLQQHAPNPQAH